MDADVRSRMEAAFGVDFAAVRIHAGAEGAQAARAAAARALTEGEDVAFAEGQYLPGTPDGERRLAHELAHVVQQRRGGSAEPSPAPAGRLERDAARAAEAVAGGQAAVVQGASAPGVAREMVSKNLTALSSQELDDEAARVKKWLSEHSIVELDYEPTERYLQEIEEERGRRRTGTAAAGPSYLDAFAAYQTAHPEQAALPSFPVREPPARGHGDGPDWSKVADALARDDNPLGIPDPARTAFEARMRKEGARDGFLPIRQRGFSQPIGYRQTFTGVTHYFDLEGKLVGTSEIPIESDAISPVDFIPVETVGSLAVAGGRAIGRGLWTAVLKYAAEEAAVEGSEIVGKLAAEEALKLGAKEAGAAGVSDVAAATAKAPAAAAQGMAAGPTPPNLATLERYADDAWRVVGGKGPRPAVAIDSLQPGVAGQYVSAPRTIVVAQAAAGEGELINTVWHEATHGRIRDVFLFMNEHLGASFQRTMFRPLDEIVSYFTGGLGRFLKSPSFVDRLIGLAEAFGAPISALGSMATPAEKALWAPHAIAYLAGLVYAGVQLTLQVLDKVDPHAPTPAAPPAAPAH
jgi:hypothetical protein